LITYHHQFTYLTTAHHQVLKEYNSLPTAQTTNGTMHKLMKLLNKYLLMVTCEYGKND